MMMHEEYLNIRVVVGDAAAPMSLHKSLKLMQRTEEGNTVEGNGNTPDSRNLKKFHLETPDCP